MPRPLRKSFAGAKYHVTVRGNGRLTVFHNEGDYLRFREQIGHAVEMDGVILYAWACLPNHAHLLIETPRGNVERFMQRLSTAYGMYYRCRHRRPGHCWEGRYKAKLVSGDDYLLRLTRYIHLNPVQVKRMKTLPVAEKLEYLDDYRWSSYRGYVDEKRKEPLVDYRWRGLLGRHTEKGSRQAYRKYLAQSAAHGDTDLRKALGANPWALGDEEFVAQVVSEMRLQAKALPHPADVDLILGEVVSLREIEAAVCEEFGGTPADLRRRSGRGVSRAVGIELACRLSGKSQRELSAHFGGVGEHAIGKQRRRLLEKLASDAELASRFARLDAALKATLSII